MTIETCAPPFLIALFDSSHVHHDLAHDWFADHGGNGWATSPITQAGFIRLATNPKIRPDAPRPDQVAGELARFCESKHHHFWPDAVSLLNGQLFSLSMVRGHRQIPDVYLLALAKHMNGTLATFDRSIPLESVRGATPRDLPVIAP